MEHLEGALNAFSLQIKWLQNATHVVGKNLWARALNELTGAYSREGRVELLWSLKNSNDYALL